MQLRAQHAAPLRLAPSLAPSFAPTITLALALAAPGCNDGVVEGGPADMAPPSEAGSPPPGGWRPVSGPLPEPTAEHLAASYLMRLIPKQGGGPGVLYCAAVQISSNLLLTAGSCFERGLGFGEVFAGERVDLSYADGAPAPRALSTIEAVYMPSDYARAGEADLALVKLTQNLTASAAVYSPLARAAVSGFVRVGYRAVSDGVFERVAQAQAPTEVFPKSLLFGVGTADLCPVPGGGVLYTAPSGDMAVVAVNARGADSCTEGGVAVRLDANEQFVLRGTAGAPTLASGETGLVLATLTCGQSLLCHNVPCQQMVLPAHQALRDALFLCGYELGCLRASCYPSSCPSEYAACLEAPPPASASPRPQGGAEVVMSADMGAGGAEADMGGLPLP